ncbi:MAG TPA: polymorphic toxin type 24 domain-containing protein [Micromonosporaceae bacterium]|nr:polymorphic toxin type 24 domain-containing protein [Micromonosporaceae bacterium]
MFVASRGRWSPVRRGVVAVVAGLLSLALAPQAAAAAPARSAVARPAAGGPATLAEVVEMERLAELAEESRLFADVPSDDALNRQLVEDLADYDEDADVRVAAREVLATNDPAKIADFLDRALPIYRAAAAVRKKDLAAANRELVERWAKSGGPTLRDRAAKVLATKNDDKIADFVAVGKAVAEAEDARAELDAADLAKKIHARVLQMVASGGYEVQSAGQAALDTEDPAVIAEFYNTGFKVTSQRDADAQRQITDALAARSKAVNDLVDLAQRSTQAATARQQIINASVAATHALTSASNSMGLTNLYAKRGDAIFAADVPVRKAGGKTRTAELTRLAADARGEAATVARYAGIVTAQAGVADTAAQTLVKTGLSHGVDWAQVMAAQSAAGQAAKHAADTARHAAEATEAASKTLDADRNATVEADNAVKYREAAERAQAAAEALADQAERLAAAAQAAERDARAQRLRAEQEARDAWSHAKNAGDHYRRAAAQRDIARQQMTVAVVQQTVAHGAAQRAIDQNNIAAAKGATAKIAYDDAKKAAETFDGLITKTQQTSARAKKAVADLNAMEFRLAAAEQEATAKAGTAEGDRAARDAATIRAQVGPARTAAVHAHGEAKTAAEACTAAGVAARRASAAAAAARAEAAAAVREAAAAHRSAEDAVAAAGKAISDAQRANEAATESVNVARAAIGRANAAKANAELTHAAAVASSYQAGIASFQARVTGRAALNARVSALAIADPAATAMDVAAAYSATDNDAAMAADIASAAMVIGAEQSASAAKHAAAADAAAVHAVEQALRAQAQVKLAYLAAEKAAKAAARAIKASKAAIDAAIGAAAEAEGAITAARDAVRADQLASQYASGAQRMAAEAGNDAAVARQAHVAARGYSKKAHQAWTNAVKIASQIDGMATITEKVAGSMQITAVSMTTLAQTLTGKIDEVSEAERKARQTAFLTRWKADADKRIDDADYLSSGAKNFFKGAAEGAIGLYGSMWVAQLCSDQVYDPGSGGSTDEPTPDEACKMLEDGVKEIIKNPGVLIHLEEWQNGEYGRALGLTAIDLIGMKVPGIGKIAGGIDALKGGLGAAFAKLLSGELMTGIATFGAKAIEDGLAKLGAINFTKLLELSVEMPKKVLTFSADEIAALRLAITTEGFDAVAAALRRLTDGTALEALKNLLKKCDGDSFAGGTPVLMADGTKKPIRDVVLGDKVLATDPEKGVTAARAVTALHRNLDTELADVVINANGHRTTIHTTQHHPFWNDTTRQWTDAADLRPRQALRTHGRNAAKVITVRSFTKAQVMYNLTVADIPTYYVMAGATPVLVHNDSANPWANAQEWKNGRLPTTGGPPNGIYYRTDNGAVVGWGVYNERGNLTYRVDLFGAAHSGVETPHWQPYRENTNPATGVTFVNDTDDAFPGVGPHGGPPTGFGGCG